MAILALEIYLPKPLSRAYGIPRWERPRGDVWPSDFPVRFEGYGGAGFSAIAAGNWSRSNVAFYGDVDLRDREERWTLGTAARTEDFEDFAATINGKLSGRVQIDREVVPRAGVSSGFRASTPGQQSVFNVSTQYVLGCLGGELAQGGEREVDRGGGQPALDEVRAVAPQHTRVKPSPEAFDGYQAKNSPSARPSERRECPLARESSTSSTSGAGETGTSSEVALPFPLSLQRVGGLSRYVTRAVRRSYRGCHGTTPGHSAKRWNQPGFFVGGRRLRLRPERFKPCMAVRRKSQTRPTIRGSPGNRIEIAKAH